MRKFIATLLLLVPSIALAQPRYEVTYDLGAKPSVNKASILPLPIGSQSQCPGGVCPPQNPWQPIQLPPQKPPQRPPIVTEESGVNVPKNIVDSSVKIMFDADGWDRWSGSGTIYAIVDGVAYIVTNKHVAPNAGKKITVYVPSRSTTEYIAKFIQADAKADLAVIAITAKNISAFVPVSKTPPTTGTIVYQVGYPGGVGPTKRSGTIVDKRTIIHEMFGPAVYTVVKIKCDYGDSGSGMFSQKTGELLCVLWGGHVCGEAYCVQHEEVARFTAKCVGKNKAPDPDNSKCPCPDCSDLATRIKAIEAELAAIKARQPVNGKDGNDGRDGKDGKDGKNGRDGRDGIDGLPGQTGSDGKDGKQGQPGRDGKSGQDGQSVSQDKIDAAVTPVKETLDVLKTAAIGTPIATLLTVLGGGFALYRKIGGVTKQTKQRVRIEEV